MYTIFYFALHTETSVQLSLELQIPIHKATRVELIHMDTKTIFGRYKKKSVVLVDILQLEANKGN